MLIVALRQGHKQEAPGKVVGLYLKQLILVRSRSERLVG